MEELTVLGAIVGGLIVLGLIVKVALLNARLQGFREAQPHIINGGLVAPNGTGCLRVFAVIGLVIFLGTCLYLGIALAATGG
jgi:hypothetical protein